MSPNAAKINSPRSSTIIYNTLIYVRDAMPCNDIKPIYAYLK